MDRIVEKSLLFDFYGDLLTEHQKKVYGEYIQEDVSISEIADLSGISRQGAHDMVRRCEKILSHYENRLHLVDHYLKIKKMAAEIQKSEGEILECDDPEDIRSQVEHITRITHDILEQY